MKVPMLATKLAAALHAADEALKDYEIALTVELRDGARIRLQQALSAASAHFKELAQ